MFHVHFLCFFVICLPPRFSFFSSACHLVLAKVGCFSVSVIFQYYSSSHHSITVISVSFSEVSFSLVKLSFCFFFCLIIKELFLLT